MLARTSWYPIQQIHSHHVMIRSFANKPKPKTKVIAYRSMQKQLFGGVVKGDATTSRYVPPVNHKIESNLNATSELSGEYFWTVQRYPHSKNVKVFNSTSSSKSPPDAQKTQRISTTVPIVAPSTDYQSQHQLANPKITTSRTSIPFTDDELQAIAKYPMLCSKADTTQMERLLHDRTTRLPSISRILQATMSDASRAALKRWKLAKINELGHDGFQQYQQEILSTGKQFHTALELYLTNGVTPEPTSPVIKLWDSLSGHLTDLKPEPVLIEKPILHTHLKYQGIVDNVSFVG